MRRLASAIAILLATGAPASAQMMLGDGAYAVRVTSMRDVPFRTVVRQQFDYSCGSAALATLLSYHYGLPVSEAEVFKAMYAVGDQAKIRKVGFSLLDMKRYLAERGLKADGYRMDLGQLQRAGRPGLTVISVGDYRHFVVIKGVRGDRVLVGDPAQGLKVYSAEDFVKVWSGVVFAIHDAPGIRAAYDSEAEWRPWAPAPLGAPLSERSLEAFTRNLPPLYQVVSPMPISGNLR